MRQRAPSSFMQHFLSKVCCAFNIFTLILLYLCGDSTGRPLANNSCYRIWLSKYLCYSFLKNVCLQWHLASLKMFSFLSKTELSFNFSRDTSFYSSVFGAVYISWWSSAANHPKQEAGKAADRMHIHKWINLVFTEYMPWGLTFRFILWSNMKLSYACAKITCREWFSEVFVCIVVFCLPQYLASCCRVFLVLRLMI